jgi:ABC-type lipoprotein export system ATPase subunit
MNREHGITFVLVTHDPDVAAHTDRMIRLNDGKVLSDVRIVAEDNGLRSEREPGWAEEVA